MPDDIEDLKQRVSNLEGLVIDLTAALKRFHKQNAERTARLDLFVALPPNTVLAQGPGLNVGVVAVPAVESVFVRLRDALVERFEAKTGRKYVFDGVKDAAAVKRLSSASLPISAIVDRWEECFTTTGFPGTQSIAQFAMRLNSFGKKSVATPPTPDGDPYAVKEKP